MKRYSKLVIPWVTYTEPEVAHTGMYERDAAQRRMHVQTIRIDLADVDRAQTDDDTEGFIKLHLDVDRILGATIVSAHAGEMISQITAAIAHGIGLSRLGSVIYPYPTESEAMRMAADQRVRAGIRPWMRWLLGRWLAFRR